jgi:hypothetical protein
MRGRCFIGTYLRELTASVDMGKHGTANITANKLTRINLPLDYRASVMLV